jgi:hypothetical protein
MPSLSQPEEIASFVAIWVSAKYDSYFMQTVV